MPNEIDGGAPAPPVTGIAPVAAPAAAEEDPHAIVPDHYVLLRPVLSGAAGKVVKMAPQPAAMHGADIRPATRADLSLFGHEPLDLTALSGAQP